MESPIPESQLSTAPAGPGCLSTLGWFLSGTILPMGSLTFYRNAARKSVGSAILFFFFLTLTITTLVTIGFGVTLFSVVGEIQKAYAQGKIPEIVIHNGVAQVDGPQPFVLVDEMTSDGRTLVAVDTTGRIREIDRTVYAQGLLLTRTELFFLNRQGQYERLPLSELHSMFNRDPILINADTMSQAWEVLSVILIVLACIFIALWYSIVRLMIIAMLGLLIWGIVSLIKPNTGFGPIIITGLYAIVPAIYLSHLFDRSGFGVPGLQSLFLMVFWVTGLVACLMDAKFLTEEPPLRLWMAWIGLPMLILYIVDIFSQFPPPYGVPALWAVTLLTGFALIGLRLFMRYKQRLPDEPAV